MSRVYKDLNWVVFGLLLFGGLFVTFSCLGVVDDLFF